MISRVHFIYADGREFCGEAIGDRAKLAEAAYDDGAIGVSVVEVLP